VSRPERRRENTSTSNFGVGRREAHDSSAFYSRFPAPEISKEADVARPSCVDRLWAGDSRHMDRHGDIADSSVALIVTSPPYYAGKEYEEAVGEGHIPAGYIEYLDMLHDVFAECVRKLEPGGRIAVNVANLGRKPYRSLSADVIGILQDRLNLLLRGEVIWHKARGAAGNCAWGSFQQPGNPTLRDLTERVVIASKGRFDRARRAEERAETGLPWVGSAFADEFMEATTDVWEIPPASANRVGHPAPFPVELPQRLIDLYTYRKDLVLDPFIGAGTTAVAAVRTGRHYVGFDTDPGYVQLAEERIKAERARLAEAGGSDLYQVEIQPKSKRRGGGNGRSPEMQPGTDIGDPEAAAPGGTGDTSGPIVDTAGGDGRNSRSQCDDLSGCSTGDAEVAPFAVNGHDHHDLEAQARVSGQDGGASRREPSAFGDFQARAVREGIKARELARRVLEECGFVDIHERVRCSCGVEMNFAAHDQSGGLWRFDVSGAFTVTQRPGLRRSDTLWKALGKAATLHFADRASGDPSPPPLVLLTTDRPARNSHGHRALASNTGDDKPIFDVIEMTDTEDLKRLGELARDGARPGGTVRKGPRHATTGAGRRTASPQRHEHALARSPTG